MGLDHVKLILAVEERFKIEIPDAPPLVLNRWSQFK